MELRAMIQRCASTLTVVVVVFSLIARSDAQNNPGIAITYNNNTFPQSCCYVESACTSCSNVYKVNSILYCCPNCNGQVIVTDLVCACYPPANTDISGYNCTMSNTVVGGYIPWRPSYYSVGASAIRASVVMIGLIGVGAWLVEYRRV